MRFNEKSFWRCIVPIHPETHSVRGKFYSGHSDAFIEAIFQTKIDRANAILTSSSITICNASHGESLTHRKDIDMQRNLTIEIDRPGNEIVLHMHDERLENNRWDKWRDCQIFYLITRPKRNLCIEDLWHICCSNRQCKDCLMMTRNDDLQRDEIHSRLFSSLRVTAITGVWDLLFDGFSTVYELALPSRSCISTSSITEWAKVTESLSRARLIGLVLHTANLTVRDVRTGILATKNSDGNVPFRVIPPLVLSLIRLSWRKRMHMKLWNQERMSGEGGLERLPSLIAEFTYTE